MSDWVLAIDFGTSATAAVVSADGTPPEVVEVGGAARVPSTVAALDDETLVAGEAAVRQLAVNPERVERSPKRRLGDRAVLLGDRAVAPTALAATVLRLVADEAIRRRGGTPPTTLRLTHPASWASTRLEALRAAAAAAGLPEPELLAEPVAAALHLSDERIAVGDHVAVYDLGGGTFDAAVLRRTADGFELVGPPGGHDRVGGEDLDERLLEHVGESIRLQDAEAWERLRFSDERAWRRAAAALRTEVRIAKESLSGAPSATVYVPAPVDLEVQVTREELEALVRPDLERTVDELLATVERAGSPALKAIYLVGGGSRMPLVGRLVAERTGITPTTWGDPKASVALGAAVSRGTTAAPAAVDPIPAAPAPEAAPAAADPEPATVVIPAQPAASRKRRPPLLVGAGVVTALVGVVAGVVLLTGGDDPKKTTLTDSPVQLQAYSFAVAKDREVTSARTWTMDKAGTTLSNETVLTNTTDGTVTRTAVEVVPKSVAARVADIQFDPGFEVVQDDPVVRYQVTLAPKGTRTIRWKRVLPTKVENDAALTALAKAQTAAEDAIEKKLPTMVPATVLAGFRLMPFKVGADPGPTVTATLPPSPAPTRSPSAKPEPSDSPATRSPDPRVTSNPPTVAANRAPALGAISSRTSDERKAVSITLAGSDPDGDRLTYSASGLPAGLAVSGAKISGTLSHAAATVTTTDSAIKSKAFSVTVTARDPKGLTAKRTFTLTVRDTHRTMPNYIGKYGCGSGCGESIPDIAELSSPYPHCSAGDATVDTSAIWRQGIAPGAVIQWGQVIHWWYKKADDQCDDPNVEKGWP